MNKQATRTTRATRTTDPADAPTTADGPQTDDLGPDPLPERRITDVETIKALSDPLRLRILEVMTAGHAETFTVKRLAATLGVNQTKLYHHVNLLVERGLILVAGQRVVSGIIETRYRVGQLRLSLDRTLVAGDGPAFHDVLVTVFDSARDDIERGLRDGVISVADEGDPAMRLLLSKGLARLSPEHAAAFRARLIELIDAFDDDADPAQGDGEPDVASDGSRMFGFVLGFYPMATTPSTEGDR